MSIDEVSMTDISESIVDGLIAEHAKETIEKNETKLVKSFDKRLNPHAPEFVPRALSLENVHLANKLTEEGEEVTSCGRIFDAIWKENETKLIPNAFMQRHYQQQRMHPYATINHWSGGHYASYLMTNRYSGPQRRAATPELRRTQSQKLSQNISLNINAPEYVPQMRRTCSSIGGECELLDIDNFKEAEVLEDLLPKMPYDEVVDKALDETLEQNHVETPNETPDETLNVVALESTLQHNDAVEMEQELLPLDTSKLTLRCGKRLLKTVPCEDDDDDDRGCCCSLM